MRSGKPHEHDGTAHDGTDCTLHHRTRTVRTGTALLTPDSPTRKPTACGHGR
jgi:hypothetical protein